MQWSVPQRRVQSRDGVSHLRFEPCLRMPGVKRIGPVQRAGIAQAAESPGKAFDLGKMTLARCMALVDPEQQPAAGGSRELQSSNREAEGAVGAGSPFDIFDS